MMGCSIARRVAGVAVLAVLLAGCAHKAQPFLPPRVNLTLGHFAGDPVSGPTTQPVGSMDPAAALAVEVRLVALGQDPTGDFEPLGPRLRLITADHGGVPVLAAGRLTRSCRWAEGDRVGSEESRLQSGALGPAADMAAFKTAIPNQVTALVQIADSGPDSSNPRGIKLFLNHTTQPDGASRLELAIGISDVPLEGDESAAPDSHPAPPRSGGVHEMAILQPLDLSGPVSAAILIPFAFTEGGNRSVLVFIHAAKGQADPETAEALARCANDLKTSAAAVMAQPTAPTLGIAQWPGLEAALDGIRNDPSRRSSLVYLATQANADICQDAALVADDHSLEELCAAILKQLADGMLPRDAAALGWALDATALGYIAQLQSANKLPPELLAVLLRHTGQVGDNSGSIDELIHAAAGRRDFDARIIAENLIYLEDNSPAARVRAFDWLCARGAAPPGYDPLAPPKQRQAALEKAFEAAAAQSATGGQP